MSSADDATVTSDDIKTEVKLLDEVETFRTPSKDKKKCLPRLSEPSNLITIPTHRRTLPEETEISGLDAMTEGGTLARSGLTRTVSKLETSVVEISKALEGTTSQPVVHGQFAVVHGQFVE